MNHSTGNSSNNKEFPGSNLEFQVGHVDRVIDTIPSRRGHFKRSGGGGPCCNKASVPGMVTQRSCVYGGARVVLMPITDAAHIVHGPVGCAACTWDIRGSRSSKSDLYKTGFSTNLEEKDVVFGGEDRLLKCILEVDEIYSPSAIFVYSTCVSGVIGDDITAVCRNAEDKTGKWVIPVQSEGFRSFNKSLGHQLACDVLLDHVIGRGDAEVGERSVNLVGEFNVAGDLWEIKRLLEKMGVKVVASITGDSTVAEISAAHKAQLNLVQCSKSSGYIAEEMEKRYGTPHINVNFFGMRETMDSLISISEFFGLELAEKWVLGMVEETKRKVARYRNTLEGKKVAIYVGGNKAWSLIRAFEDLGMEVIMSGTQNGLPNDYLRIMEKSGRELILFDDANPVELSRLLNKYRPDLFVSGAKEKYLSYKLGIPFCEFNHDRIKPFSCFRGFLNFAEEVDKAVNSRVWKLTAPRTFLNCGVEYGYE